MLATTVDRGIPARRRSLSPFSPNIVPAPESHRSVAALRRHKLHITRPAVNGRSRSFRCASSPLKIFDFAGTPFFGGESWHGHILFGRSFSFPLRQFPLLSLLELFRENARNFFRFFLANRKKPIYMSPLPKGYKYPFKARSHVNRLCDKSKPVCTPSCQQAENRRTASAFGSSRSVSGSSGAPQPVA